MLTQFFSREKVAPDVSLNLPQCLTFGCDFARRVAPDDSKSWAYFSFWPSTLILWERTAPRPHKFTSYRARTISAEGCPGTTCCWTSDTHDLRRGSWCGRMFRYVFQWTPPCRKKSEKIEKPTYRGVAHLHVCIFLNLGDVDDVGDDDDDGDDDVGDVKVEAGIASWGKTRKLSGKAFVGDLRQKMGVRVLQNQGFLQDSSTTDSYFSSILLYSTVLYSIRPLITLVYPTLVYLLYSTILFCSTLLYFPLLCASVSVPYFILPFTLLLYGTYFYDAPFYSILHTFFTLTLLFTLYSSLLYSALIKFIVFLLYATWFSSTFCCLALLYLFFPYLILLCATLLYSTLLSSPLFRVLLSSVLICSTLLYCTLLYSGLLSSALLYSILLYSTTF